MKRPLILTWMTDSGYPLSNLGWLNEDQTIALVYSSQGWHTAVCTVHDKRVIQDDLWHARLIDEEENEEEYYIKFVEPTDVGGWLHFEEMR